MGSGHHLGVVRLPRTEHAKLKQVRKAVREDLIAEFHQLQKANGSTRHDKYRKLQSRVRALRKRLYDNTKRTVYDEFFRNIGSQIIKQNHRGKLVRFELETSHIQPERRVLTKLEFKNRDIELARTASDYKNYALDYRSSMLISY